ncbi:hypothetical protein [Sphingobium yanoikuyae]|jgi:hypothetical protein|uniref:hypothetical protein n=1 Tax=Sphingobium yanoikuyae TaxID=13690 RepID=UPI0028A7FEBA|nr:hypothetical protein [Sphingobium yanoikuyae]
MSEVESTPISSEELQEKMRDDITALLSNDIHCPLARAIEEALAARRQLRWPVERQL